jgi:uncharacterized protein (TIGR01244 family)
VSVDRRAVTDAFQVSGQIVPPDLAALAASGTRLIVNNRPDGEAPDQPTGAEIEAAARAAGLRYVAIPVRGVPPTPAEARAAADAVAAADGPVHAFCRSGARSIMAWAMGEALAGRRTPDELVRLGAAAGYDLRPLFP